MKTNACAILVGLLSTFCTLSILADEKTDVVVLVNGDSVTGEVKSLEFGSLKYKTDSMGTVEIDWEDILSISSNQALQIEISNGTRYFGNLGPASQIYNIAVESGELAQELSMSNVIRMTPIETDERFVGRLEGSASFGFNTDKASDVMSSNLTANIRYRTLEYLVGFSLNSTITNQETVSIGDRRNAETTQAQSLDLNYQRFRDNRWYTDWFTTLEKNDELGINSRFSLGGGLGRYIVQTNKNQLSVLAGLVATRESFVGEESSTTNAEGKISISYLRRSLKPSSDITLTANVFPLLEDLSSFRAESNLSFRREFIEDLFFDISIRYSYQSDPTEGAEKDDYGVVTSLGYSF
jgi:putative salt-induced outer membrane protein YdiY